MIAPVPLIGVYAFARQAGSVSGNAAANNEPSSFITRGKKTFIDGHTIVSSTAHAYEVDRKDDQECASPMGSGQSRSQHIHCSPCDD
jgi:hypothetical protein